MFKKSKNIHGLNSQYSLEEGNIYLDRDNSFQIFKCLSYFLYLSIPYIYDTEIVIEYNTIRR